MGEENNTNKMLTIGLVVVVAIAVIVLMYVNLPQEDTTTDEGTEDANGTNEVMLNVTYDNIKHEYTLEELEDLPSITGTGRKIKAKLLPDAVIIDPDLNDSAWQFTGVAISTFLGEFENLSDNYNVTAIGSDEWEISYTKDNVTGHVNVYNETGQVVRTNDTTMILAYKQDNDYISDEYGPLRIAFVDSGAITNSALWAKYVVTIEIT